MIYSFDWVVTFAVP